MCLWVWKVFGTEIELVLWCHDNVHLVFLSFMFVHVIFIDSTQQCKIVMHALHTCSHYEVVGEWLQVSRGVLLHVCVRTDILLRLVCFSRGLLVVSCVLQGVRLSLLPAGNAPWMLSRVCITPRQWRYDLPLTRGWDQQALAFHSFVSQFVENSSLVMFLLCGRCILVLTFSF